MNNTSLQSWIGVFAIALVGCGEDNNGKKDDRPETCQGTGSPTAKLGAGIGGAFLPYTDAQTVLIDVAPQGGFGVPALIQTTGIEAGVDRVANVEQRIEDSSGLLGEFRLSVSVQCNGDGSGGIIAGVVVGLDPTTYSTNDDLLAVDGSVVDLVVTVADPDGNFATTRQPVTLRVGS